MTAKRAAKLRRAHRVSDLTPVELRHHLSVTLRDLRVVKVAGFAALKLLLEMEREGALRLPFPQHQETMVKLRTALGMG
jgi:hypothetical protein